MQKSEFYKDYKKARDKTWEIIFKYNINRLPVPVKDLCERMNIKLYTYSSGKEIIKDYKLFEHMKNEGFSANINGHNTIFYDDTILPHSRKRFTVTHEIGHHGLGHVINNVTVWNRGEMTEPNPIESAANIFAARLLAPACVLHALDIHSSDEIMALCGLSRRAAKIRAVRMAELYEREKLWKKIKGYSCFGMSPLEQKALKQFDDFIKEYKKADKNI